jgi:hypothetical protein
MQPGLSVRLPMASSAGAPTALWMSPSVTRDSEHDSTQPPPWPLAELTKPACRRPAMSRRTTTGLVCIAGRERLGGDGPVHLGHVQQHVENA